MPKISNLPAAASSALTDIFPAVQGGITKKETLQQVLTLFNANIVIAESQVTGLVADLASKLNLSGGTMTGDLILFSSSPPTSLSAASKGYVDSQVAVGSTVFAARMATTAALTATYANGTAGVGATLTNAGAMAAFSADGVTGVANDVVLVKNQASSFQNGLYSVTTVGSGAANWVLTRVTGYDTAAEIQPGDLVVVNEGTTLTNTGWRQTATVATMGTDAISFSQFTSSFPLPLSLGGTNANLTAANGAIPYSTATAIALLAPGSSGQIIRSGGAGAPTWSTATYPATAGTLGNVLKSDGTNWVSAADTPGALTDAHIYVGDVSNVAQDVAVSGDATMANTGALSVVSVTGTATNDNAAAGKVGQFISSVIAAASAVNAGASGVAANVTSISLTAGDWDVWGNASLVDAGTNNSAFFVWVSSTSASIPDQSLYMGTSLATVFYSAGTGHNAPQLRFSLAATTTIYLSVATNYTAGTPTLCGGLYARRRR